MDTQREFYKDLIGLWDVGDAVPSRISIQNSLSIKTSKLIEAINICRLLGRNDEIERVIEKGGLVFDFVERVASSVKLYNMILGKPDSKWALCFDELELAPAFLQKKLRRLLRSSHPEILFKVASSPYSGEPEDQALDPSGAAEGDDFTVIPLWYSEKDDADEFSRDIVRGVLASRGIKQFSLNQFFGESLVGGDSSRVLKGQSQSIRETQFRQLREKDPSFVEFLGGKGEIPVTFADMTEELRAEIIRKTYPVVVHRNYFLKITEKKVKLSRAGRKSMTLYSGWQNIFAMCEGNPRTLIGLITDMLSRCREREPLSVDRATQWAAIESARHRLEAKLMAFKVTEKGFDKGLMALVNLLGEQFKEDLLGEKFKAEPVGSFVMDTASYDWLSEAVGLGLNVGAFVYVPRDKGKIMLRTIKEKRFRINYLLASKYFIPLRIGSDRTIRKLLGTTELENQLLIPLHEHESE